MTKGDNFQVIASAVVVFEGEPAVATRTVYHRGSVIDGDRISKGQVERYLKLGAIRETSDEPLPAANAEASAEAAEPTTPAGEPIRNAELVEPAAEELKKPRSHKAADQMLSELGVAAPADASVATKWSIIQQVHAAQTGGEESPTSEDLTALSEDELVQRAIDYGHSEEELVELEKDALVLVVAEAMNRQTADPQEQERRTAELAAERDEE